MDFTNIGQGVCHSGAIKLAILANFWVFETETPEYPPPNVKFGTAPNFTLIRESWQQTSKSPAE